jgi:putative ABC transport system permease protein
VEGLPGVRSAGLAGTGPFSGREDTPPVGVPESQPQAEGPDHIIVDRVSPHFFESLGVPLLAGRDFSFADQEGAPKTAIVDEAVAHNFFSGVSPLGRRIVIRAPNVSEFEIIGVVKATKHKSLKEEAQGAVYLSLLQGNRPWMPTLYVRATNSATALTAAVRQVFQELDKDLPVFDITTFERQLNESLAQDRLVATLSSFFGILAALLAAIGLYGVMAYSVSARTREVGIRMALGAQQADVVKLVLKGGMSLAGIGVGFGLLASLALTRLMKGLLFGVGANDPLTFSAITLLLLGAAWLACWLPARRATKVDPLTALRHE